MTTAVSIFIPPQDFKKKHRGRLYITENYKSAMSKVFPLGLCDGFKK